MDSGFHDTMQRIQDIIHRFEKPVKQTESKQQIPVEKNILNRDLPESKSKISFQDELNSLIEKVSLRNHVNPDLVKAVVKVESNGNKNAVSSKGAIGLMQLMPGTAKLLGVNPNDPEQNLEGGIRYLKDLAKQFGNLNEALAAYNAGPGAVKKYKGIPPYAETQEYVKKIRKHLLDIDA